ncbi:MAG: hypothetical protein AAB794_02565 [Patescibacteria group bacterium]
MPKVRIEYLLCFGGLVVFIVGVIAAIIAIVYNDKEGLWLAIPIIAGFIAMYVAAIIELGPRPNNPNLEPPPPPPPPQKTTSSFSRRGGFCFYTKLCNTWR